MDMSEVSELDWFELANKRDVPEWLVGNLMAKLDKLNARAAKLGLDGFTITKGEVFERKRWHDAYGRYIVERLVTVTVEGPKVKLAGWDLIGRIDFEDGMILVNARPDRELPVNYRAATPFCEHCKSDRRRNSVFVFKHDDGHHIQVGRSCLKDFMGVEPTAALWALSAFRTLVDEIDEDMRGSGGSGHYRVALTEVMQAGAQSIRESGFASRKAVMDGKAGTATASDVDDLLFNPRVYAMVSTRYGMVEGRKRPTAEESAADMAKGLAVIDWVLQTWGPKANKSDYEYNAVELLQQESVSPKRIGLLVSLIAAYNREHEEKAKRERLVDAWVGKLKERRVFEAVYQGCNSFDGNFGTFWVARFATAEGMLVYKGNSPFWNTGLNGGESIKLIGTIKAHDDYKGFKQTLISRCEVLDDEAFAAAVAKAAKAAERAAKKAAKVAA